MIKIKNPKFYYRLTYKLKQMLFSDTYLVGCGGKLFNETTLYACAYYPSNLNTKRPIYKSVKECSKRYKDYLDCKICNKTYMNLCGK